MPARELPPVIPADRLADACREVAGVERVQPAAVEKDYYLTRLITALANEMGKGILLKGFNRMSEDVARSG